MQSAQGRGLPVHRALVGEQLAGLAPVDDLRRAAAAGHPAVPQGHGGHLPGEWLRRGRDADVDHLLASHLAPDQLAGQQALARPQLELAQIHRCASQPDAVVFDVGHAAHADEHPPPLHGDDEPVDAGWTPAEADHHVDHVPDVRAVRTQQRQTRQS